MKHLIIRSLVVACACASAGSFASTPAFLADGSRTVTGGRAVEVLVAQSEIKSDINPSNIAAATGGGILGGLLAASQNASRAKKAEATIEPLRNALTGFDGDALALDTTKAGLADVAWLQPTAITESKDTSLLGESAFLDKSGADQTVFVEYSYDMSPDFAAVRVVAKINIAGKAMPVGATKAEERLSPRNLLDAINIISVVTLPDAASKDPAANAARWSADGAKAARAALTEAFTEIQKLMPRALALSKADVVAMNGKDKPKKVVGGYLGRVQESNGDATLLWSTTPSGFVHIQALS